MRRIRVTWSLLAFLTSCYFRLMAFEEWGLRWEGGTLDEFDLIFDFEIWFWEAVVESAFILELVEEFFIHLSEDIDSMVRLLEHVQVNVQLFDRLQSPDLCPEISIFVLELLPLPLQSGCLKRNTLVGWPNEVLPLLYFLQLNALDIVQWDDLIEFLKFW